MKEMFVLKIKTHFLWKTIRYVHKRGNGMVNIASDVLCRLSRIAHSLKVSDVQTPVKDFKEWEICKGKLKNWFEGNTYFKVCPKIK